MKWLEKISIRITEADREEIAAELLPRLPAAGAEPGLLAARLYEHREIETDLCIHLHWEGEESAPPDSSLGWQTAEGLRSVGLVHRSFWREWTCDNNDTREE